MQYDKIIRKILQNTKKYAAKDAAKIDPLEANLGKTIANSKHDPKSIEKVYNTYQQYANNINDPRFKYANYDYKSRYNLEKALEVLDEIAQGRSPTKYSDFIDYDFNIAGRKIPVSQFNTGNNPSESFKKVFEDATGKNYNEYIKNKNTPKDTRFDIHNKEDQFTGRRYYEPDISQKELDSFIDETFFKDRPDLQLTNNSEPLDFVDNIGTELDPEFANYTDDKLKLFTNVANSIYGNDFVDSSAINLLDKLYNNEAWNALHPYDNYLRKIKRQYDIQNDLEAYGKTDLNEIIDKLFK